MAAKARVEEKPSIPKRLGKYRVIEEVGAGGLGRVFKAIDEKTGITVAIKVLHDRLMREKKFLGIFHRELLIMSRLHHRHIVSYQDSYFQPPVCYVVTSYVEGWSGFSLMRKAGKIPPLVALSIMIDVLQGLDHLHLHDTVHSDLSAANFMIDRKGRVFVMDFGLSCQTEIEDYKNYMVGTPGYYSPEHISETPMGPYTDIYCAALILFEMIAGKKAVPVNQDRFEVLKTMKQINFKQIKCKNRKMQRMIRSLLKDALKFNYLKRTSNVETMILQIFEILKMFNIHHTRYVIHRYLIDKKMVPGPFRGDNQNIYEGFIELKG